MRNWRLILVGCLVFCLCAGLVQAQVVKQGHTTLDDLVASSPRMGVAQAVLPVEELRSEAAAMEAPGMEAVAADWDRFVTDHGSQWDLMLDRRTGRPALASGSGVPWVPGEGNLLTRRCPRNPGRGRRGDPRHAGPPCQALRPPVPRADRRGPGGPGARTGAPATSATTCGTSSSTACSTASPWSAPMSSSASTTAISSSSAANSRAPSSSMRSPPSPWRPPGKSWPVTWAP